MKDARKVCHNSEETSLRNALVAYENAGIALTLGGRPSTPRELARLCVIREKAVTWETIFRMKKANSKKYVLIKSKNHKNRGKNPSVRSNLVTSASESRMSI